MSFVSRLCLTTAVGLSTIVLRPAMSAAQAGSGTATALPASSVPVGEQPSGPGVIKSEAELKAYIAAHHHTAAGVSKDSLAILKKAAAAKHPLVIINDEVKTLKVFNTLSADTVATVQWKAADDESLKYYGKAAQNGILSVTTKPKETTPKNVQPGNTTSTAPTGAVIQHANP
jgi:hypothetical protein